ncbi:MAG: glycosyltransferase family 4 protein [Pseudomonadota bacterium]
MRILAISHDSTLYGAQRSFCDTVEGLDAMGHEIEVCTPRPGPLVERLQTARIPVIIHPFRLWLPIRNASRRWTPYLMLLRLPAAIFRAIQIIKRGNYDVVYTNTVTVIDFAIAARLLGKSHIWHLREAAAGNEQLRCLFSNALIGTVASSLSRYVIYNSKHLKKTYAGVRHANALVVHNGFTWNLPDHPVPARVDGQVRLLTVGYMGHLKGLDLILEALLRLDPETLARLSLDIAGEVDRKYWSEHISARIELLNTIRPTVRHLGWVADTSMLYSNADILVSASRGEAFGRSLVEAMGYGLPVIATRCGGPSEIVMDGETGIMLEVGDISALANAITTLVEDPTLRTKMGCQAKLHAHARFSLPVYLENMNEIFLSTARANSSV